MKKSLFFITLFICARAAIAGDGVNKKSPLVINVLDTVVFDLSKTVTNGSSVMFPVSFLSDDIINTLDFSLKFNETYLTYDSVVNHKTYLAHTAYFNTSDRTLRFTSNSLQPIENNKPLVSLVFTSTSGKISAADLNSIKAYLNGDPCSIKVIDTISHVSVKEYSNKLKAIIAPNPVTDALVIILDRAQEAFISIYNVSGKLVKAQPLTSGTRFSISCKNFASGVYLYRIDLGNEEGFSGRFVKE